MTNWQGVPGSIYESECLATNSRIHDEMMAVLRETTLQSGGMVGDRSR